MSRAAGALLLSLLVACGAPASPPGASAGGEAPPPIRIAEVVAQRVHRGRPDTFRVSPDGRFLATASRYTIAITDLERGVVRRAQPDDLGEEAWAYELAWAEEGRVLAVLVGSDYGGGSAFAREIDGAFAIEADEVFAHAGMAVAPGPMLVTIPPSTAWQLEGRRAGDREPSWTAVLPVLDGTPGALRLSDDGTLVAVATDADELVVVALASGAVVASEPPVDESAVCDDCEDWPDPPSTDDVPILVGLGTGGLVALHADGRLTVTTSDGTRALATGCGSPRPDERFVDLGCDGGEVRLDLATLTLGSVPDDVVDEDEDDPLAPTIERLGSSGEYSLWEIGGSLEAGVTTAFQTFEVRWSASGVETVETDMRYPPLHDPALDPSCGLDVNADDEIATWGLSGEGAVLAGATSLEPEDYRVADDCQSITRVEPDGVTIWSFGDVPGDPMRYPPGSRVVVGASNVLVVARGDGDAYEVVGGAATAGPFAGPAAGCDFADVLESEDGARLLARVEAGLLVVDAAAWWNDDAEPPGARFHVVPLPTDACDLELLDDGRLFAATPTEIALLDLDEVAPPVRYPRPGHAGMREGRLVDCVGAMRVYDLETGAPLGGVSGPCDGARIEGQLVFRGADGGRSRARVERLSDGAGLLLVVLSGEVSAVAAVTDDGAIWCETEDDVLSFALALSDGGVLDRTMIHGEAMRARYSPTLLADFFEGRPLPAAPPLR